MRLQRGMICIARVLCRRGNANDAGYMGMPASHHHHHLRLF